MLLYKEGVTMDLGIELYNTQENKLKQHTGELLNGSLEETALGVPGWWVDAIGAWGFITRNHDTLIYYYFNNPLPFVSKHRIIDPETVEDLDHEPLHLEECQAMFECLRYIREKL